MTEQRAKVRVPDLLKMKRGGQKITMLTAYDATMALLLDRAGIDVILVGDSLGMVVLGEATTVGVTLEMMSHHCRAVANGAASALVVADLPFLTYQTSVTDAVRNAGRLVQQGRASAVKLEGGTALGDTVRAIVNAGIPVMGHVGLLPQSVHMLGGFRAVGKTEREAEQILRDVKALEEAGAFAVVLECLSAELAARVTKESAIPTIGIGSGPGCDGQVLVSYDAFGMYQGFVPRFVKQYADLGAAMTDAARSYIDEVRNGAFPSS
jgi:3-methyl-2-oxobutanoate hydroxymethyltransferase